MARILIADDSEVMRQQLKTALTSRANWTICGEAVNGVSAILKAHELKPDLVIMDLVMPMLDGLRASAEIAKTFPTIPIVIYSLHLVPELEVEAKKYGVWELVSKSADQNLLIETVERLLAASQPANSRNELDANLREKSDAPTTSSNSITLDAGSTLDSGAEPD